jgi:hypothetical protein
MKINLHIERLVVDGVNIAPGQGHLLQAGIESELARMLTEGGLSPDFTRSLALSRLSTSAVQMPEAGNPKHVGEEIAKSVYGGIGHE